MKQTKFNNPLFESLNKTVKEFTPEPEFVIYEGEGTMSESEFLEKFNLVLSHMQMNILRILQSIPIDELRKDVATQALSDLSKLTNSDSTDNVIKSMNEIWKTAVSKIDSSEYKDALSPIYKKYGEGIAKLMEYYSKLKEEGSEALKSDATLKSVNTEMENFIKSTKLSLETTKKVLTK